PAALVTIWGLSACGSSDDDDEGVEDIATRVSAEGAPPPLPTIDPNATPAEDVTGGAASGPAGESATAESGGGGEGGGERRGGEAGEERSADPRARPGDEQRARPSGACRRASVEGGEDRERDETQERAGGGLGGEGGVALEEVDEEDRADDRRERAHDAAGVWAVAAGDERRRGDEERREERGGGEGEHRGRATRM
ncbi:MAG TPA: hypothetical protein VN238_16090, partial [Solirubrobacteraceae bacterium]|nr:hypothetical protein [Solirubrobacteraceae bacterium]